MKELIEEYGAVLIGAAGGMAALELLQHLLFGSSGVLASVFLDLLRR